MQRRGEVFLTEFRLCQGTTPWSSAEFGRNRTSAFKTLSMLRCQQYSMRGLRPEAATLTQEGPDLTDPPSAAALR